MKLGFGFCCACALPWPRRQERRRRTVPPASPLDRYVTNASAPADAAPTPGSIWLAGSRLADAARDVRASQVDDVLTIVVAEQASAVTTGTTKTRRTSSTKNSISALAGITKAAGPLANLAGMSGDTQLNGQGTTSRVHHVSPPR